MIGDVFKTAFGTNVVDLIRLDAKVREGDSPEALHDARVAVRRLRSYLRTFLPILDGVWACALRERLRWLNERFAEARDLDVLLEGLERSGTAAGGVASASELLERVRAERDRRHQSVQAALRDARYLTLLEEIVAAARQPQFVGQAQRPARPGMRRLLSAVWKRARKRVRRYGRRPTDAQLHEIRIKTKHVRYAAECLEPFDGKPVKALVRHAERLQSLLGNQHDAVMAAARLRDFIGSAPWEDRSVPRPRWRPVWRKMRRAYRRLGRSGL
ncbi:MAG: CHAD domain-containing protein [Candidatus Tumulicola sp.]